MGALLLSLSRPSREQQKSCIHNDGCFNYDADYHCATSRSDVSDSTLVDGGFHVNRARVPLGSGLTAFRQAEAALRTWRHFGTGWAFVDPDTPIEKGVSFCVCVREFLPWVAMPLQIVYVKDKRGGDASGSIGKGSSFGFGSGTLRGHLLAGEERFSIEWDENDQVWYEIFSFSKPAHILSSLSYPYVKMRQRYFAKQSAEAILNYVGKQETLV